MQQHLKISFSTYMYIHVRYVLCGIYMCMCMYICMYDALQAKFMPYTGESVVVTAARDGQVKEGLAATLILD